MPRRPRIAPGGLVYHSLNRGVARYQSDSCLEANYIACPLFAGGLALAYLLSSVILSVFMLYPIKL